MGRAANRGAGRDRVRLHDARRRLLDDSDGGRGRSRRSPSPTACCSRRTSAATSNSGRTRTRRRAAAGRSARGCCSTTTRRSPCSARCSSPVRASGPTTRSKSRWATRETMSAWRGAIRTSISSRIYRLRLTSAGRYLERVVDGVAENVCGRTLSRTRRRPARCSPCTARGACCGQLDGELLFDPRSAPAAHRAGRHLRQLDRGLRALSRAGLAGQRAGDTERSTGGTAGQLPCTPAGSRTADGSTRSTSGSTHARERADRRSGPRRLDGLPRGGERPGGRPPDRRDRPVPAGQCCRTFTCYRLLVNLNLQSVNLARLSGTFTARHIRVSTTRPDRCLVLRGRGLRRRFRPRHARGGTDVRGRRADRRDRRARARARERSGGLGAGKAGLYYLGADEPVFTDLVVRSAPRGTVQAWSFVTSRYPGFVEHLDSFVGQVYREAVSGVDVAARRRLPAAAQAEMASAAAALADARALLAGAAAADLASAARPRWPPPLASATAAEQFDALYALLLGGAYRPLPPVVEVSEIVQSRKRLALLLESPEPLDWSRMTGSSPGRIAPAGTSRLPAPSSSERRRRSGVVLEQAVRLLRRQLRAPVVGNLDIGLEAPVLRRGGSTLPEVARLSFTLA